MNEQADVGAGSLAELAMRQAPRRSLPAAS